MSAKALGQYAPFLIANKAAAYDRLQQRERRSRARTKLHWPVLFRYDSGDALETVTENLSSQGFYCLSQTPFSFGEVLLCWLIVPVHDPSRKKGTVRMECHVRVVRSEPAAEVGLFGVACRIEDYRFVDCESVWRLDRIGKRSS